MSDDDPLALPAEEKQALIALLRESFYPLAPRLDPLKAILAKLDPPPLKPGTTAASAGRAGPRVGRGRQRR